MRCARDQTGFTLLEMLFVLFVVGLLVSLTVPRFAAGYELRELQQQQDDIADQIRELPRQVRLSAHPLKLANDRQLNDFGKGGPMLRMPPGWSATFTPPLEISLLGVCSASKLLLQHQIEPMRAVKYQVAALNCELTTSSS